MKGSWVDYELTIELDSGEKLSEQIKTLLKKCTPEYREQNPEMEEKENADKLILLPLRSELFIFDNMFISSCRDHIAAFLYYEPKLKNPNMLFTTLIKDNCIGAIELGEYQRKIDTYKNLLKTVVIDFGILKKSNICVPPDLFYQLSQYEEEQDNYCTYFAEFLSLLVIADRVVQLDNEPMIFEFFINSDEYSKTIVHKWKDIQTLSSGYWYACYRWINADEQRSVDLDLKRNIVRNSISRNYSEEAYRQYSNKNIDYLHSSFNDIMRIIISGRSRSYFETQSTLKNEYVEIFRKSKETYTTAINYFLTLLVAIAVGIYGVISNQGIVVDLAEPNISLVVFLIMIFGAELFILITTVINKNSLQDYILKLRNIYSTKFFISVEDQDVFLSFDQRSLNNIIVFQKLLLALTLACITYFVWGHQILM